jgi:hypothetical protein
MSGHLPGCFMGEPFNATTNPQICICDRLRAAEQRGRKDAARDLRAWIHDNHPSIKGYADIYVEGALDVVEGKP